MHWRIQTVVNTEYVCSHLHLVTYLNCCSFVFYIYTCSLYRVELVVQFPERGFTQVLLCPFHGVLWLWHFLYSVGPHPVSSLHIYTFVVSRAFIAGAASQAGDADSSRAPGLTSGLQGSVNVHRVALLLVTQWQCISSFVFYILNYGNLCCQGCPLFYDVTTLKNNEQVRVNIVTTLVSLFRISLLPYLLTKVVLVFLLRYAAFYLKIIDRPIDNWILN